MKAKRTHDRISLLVGVGLLLGSSVSGVQAARAADPSDAQTLFNEAVAAMDKQQYSIACPKLEEVTRLMPDGLGAKLTLGECYEGWGKLASAWSQYTLVESLAAKAGQDERSRQAAEKARGLRPRLATVRIDVPDEVRLVAGILITRDGAEVSESEWGVAVPVDAGSHTIVARTSGREPWEKRLEDVTDGASIVVTPSLPELERESTSGAETSGFVGSSSAAPSTEKGRAWQRPAGFAASGVGALGLGVGTVLGGLSLAKGADSNHNGHCDVRSVCDQVGFALRNEARALGDGSTATFIVGGALLAGGVALVLLAPASPKQRKESTSASIGISLNGIRIEGAW